jgi:hypothetical protein|tara:strand:+ start:229 stop:486 length:258 start_codon:yes stop_codon:yes gene_type:complete
MTQREHEDSELCEALRAAQPGELPHLCIADRIDALHEVNDYKDRRIKALEEYRDALVARIPQMEQDHAEEVGRLQERIRVLEQRR